MIVESMTYEEICREYNRIHDIYFPRVQSKMRKDGALCSDIRRLMIKHKSLKNVLFAPLIHQVDNTTTFCAIPKVHDYKTFTRIGPIALTFITYLNKYGMNAVVRGGNYDNNFAILTSHFFERYMDRFIGKKISKIEAIGEFFANNESFIMTPHPTKDKPNNMIGCANDVVFFSEALSDTITIIKTCITREQLFETQTQSAELLDKLTDEFDVEREFLKQYIVKQSNNPYFHASYF